LFEVARLNGKARSGAEFVGRTPAGAH
jgi:hypothetical protein